MKDKVVVITGAGGVLCSTIAKAYAKKGAKVAVLDLKLESAQKVVDEIVKDGGIAKAYAVNCLEKKTMEEAKEKINKELGKCDILVNGAGGNNPRATTDHEYYLPGDIDADIDTIIYRSLKFKKGIVEQDETEQGARRALNFGHTIGHGIEAVKGNKGRRTTGLYHGECVALGMLPMIENKTLQKRTRAVYRRLGLPLRTGFDKEKVLAEMLHDKKAQDGRITVIKVPGLGCWRADTLPVESLRVLLGMEEGPKA